MPADIGKAKLAEADGLFFFSLNVFKNFSIFLLFRLSSSRSLLWRMITSAGAIFSHLTRRRRRRQDRSRETPAIKIPTENRENSPLSLFPDRGR